jgi:hypothetical protein
LIVPQIDFIPGPHAVGAAPPPLDKDKDASAKTHPPQTVRAGKRIIKIQSPPRIGSEDAFPDQTSPSRTAWSVVD